jgi:ParB family chromosome partitioning protein
MEKSMDRRLGRGLGSLLGQTNLGTEPAEANEIEIELIRPNPHQPRKEFEESALVELSRSIAQHGLLQPICVRRSGTGYEIISGERRYRAARLVGKTRLQAVVREDVSDDQMLELAMVENLQREDLDPIEKARGFRDMAARLKLTQEQVAERVGLKRATVTNHLRLLDLPKEVQDAVRGGLITMGHARALLSLSSDSERLRVLGRIVREGWSVRQVEQLGQATGGKVASPSMAGSQVESSRPAWVAGLEERLRSALGTKVAVQNGVKYRGRLVLEYYNRDDLDRLVERLDPGSTL